MVRRYARRYSDGSFNVDLSNESLEHATKRLNESTDDDDTEIVEVEIEIVATFGRPKLRLVSGVRPTCGRSHEPESAS